MTTTLRRTKSKRAGKAASPQRTLDQHNDYASIVAAISRSQAIIEFELDGTIITANDNFLRTMGYRLEEIQGRHHGMFVTEAQRQSAEYREFWARLARGEFQSADFKRLGKDGKEVWLQASYNPVLDAGGRPVKVVKIAADITAIANARSDAARISSMVEQAPINVMFADREFRIRYLNRASAKTLKELEHLLPVKADQVLGQSFDVFHKQPEYQRRIVSDPKNLPHRAEIRLGKETLDLLVSPVFGEDKSFLGAMLTWDVVTKRVEMEIEIKDNKRKAEALGDILSTVAGNAATLSSSSESLAAVSTQMAANSEETAVQANVVSAAADQVSSNVQTVATGVEEMSASIREIAANASEAAKIVEQAVLIAGTTNQTIAKLGDSSNDIGKVIKVITSIAEQTNLLALNATIEAARAGEAGKGFAVVANEVKELAKDTAKATEDIGQKIEAIQMDSRGAVEAIKQIGDIIARVNAISSTIASAVEEQAATTNEISRNVAEAAQGSTSIAQNITSVAKAAQSTTEGASSTQQAASELSRMAIELQKIVSQSR
ncbi:MAG: methyl-accepting chemotaxis protein [Pirellulales bacterium]|nr:methyl-accepting chemotaxis protein [Pirellulales bacterium]